MTDDAVETILETAFRALGSTAQMVLAVTDNGQELQLNVQLRPEGVPAVGLVYVLRMLANQVQTDADVTGDELTRYHAHARTEGRTAVYGGEWQPIR
jgi:hypothetical protein